MCSAMSCATSLGLRVGRVDAAQLDEHADDPALVLDVLVAVERRRRWSRSAPRGRARSSRRASPTAASRGRRPSRPRTGWLARSSSPCSATSSASAATTRLELVALGDEVGLAVELDERADVAVDEDVDGALVGSAPGALGGAGECPSARSQSLAASMSPSVSSSAFLQSIIPAPVCLAQRGDVLGGDVSHCSLPPAARSWPRRRVRFGGAGSRALAVGRRRPGSAAGLLGLASRQPRLDRCCCARRPRRGLRPARFGLAALLLGIGRLGRRDVLGLGAAGVAPLLLRRCTRPSSRRRRSRGT